MRPMYRPSSSRLRTIRSGHAITQLHHARRPEPSHPLLRLLALVLIGALACLLFQFGRLLERDGALLSAPERHHEVSR